MSAGYSSPYGKDSGALLAFRGIPVRVARTLVSPAIAGLCCMLPCGARNHDTGWHRPCPPRAHSQGKGCGAQTSKQPLSIKMIAVVKQSMKCSRNTRGTPQS